MRQLPFIGHWKPHQEEGQQINYSVTGGADGKRNDGSDPRESVTHRQTDHHGDEGRYRDRLLHYPTFDQAIGAFLKGEAPVFAGDRSLIEGAIHRAGRSPDTVGIVSPQETEWMPLKWTVGGAVKTDSRDLAYAVNDALASMRETGELQRIFAGYGVTYVPPPGY